MKRKLSLFFSLIFLFTLIFSVVWVDAQANHEHLDDSRCLVCEQIRNCSDFLRDSSSALGTEKISRIFAPVRKIVFPRRAESPRYGASTPISLKVKLTN